MDTFTLNRSMYTPKLLSPTLSSPNSSPIYEGRKPAACRCLFGRPSPRERWETRRTLRELEAREIDRITEKYNFDIRISTPLQGRFEWETVGKDENVLFGEKVSKEIENVKNERVPDSSDSGLVTESSDNFTFLSSSSSSLLSSSDSKTVDEIQTVTSQKKPVTNVQVNRKRKLNGNLQMTDFYPVCKKVRFWKKRDQDN